MWGVCVGGVCGGCVSEGPCVHICVCAFCGRGKGVLHVGINEFVTMEMQFGGHMGHSIYCASEYV